MEKTYTTHDFYTAILLRIKQIPLIEIRRLDGRFVEFEFGANPVACEKLKQDYWSRKPINIALRDVVDEIKHLKGIIHEELNK